MGFYQGLGVHGKAMDLISLLYTPGEEGEGEKNFRELGCVAIVGFRGCGWVEAAGVRCRPSIQPTKGGMTHCWISGLRIGGGGGREESPLNPTYERLPLRING